MTTFSLYVSSAIPALSWTRPGRGMSGYKLTRKKKLMCSYYDHGWGSSFGENESCETRTDMQEPFIDAHSGIVPCYRK